MKKGKKESYDLIVNINLDEWKLTPEQEIFSGGWTWQLYSQCVGCWTEGSLHAVWPRRGWSPLLSGAATRHEVHGPETFRFSEVVFHLRFIDFKIQMSCCWRMCGRCPKTTSTTPWSSMSSCRWWRSSTRMNTPELISSRPLGTDLQDHQDNLFTWHYVISYPYKHFRCNTGIRLPRLILTLDIVTDRDHCQCYCTLHHWQWSWN